MSTRNGTNWTTAVLVVMSLSGCGMPPPGDEPSKPLPASSLQYHLHVDPASLPAGVVARQRQVAGTTQIQTWIRNESDIPFVILGVNSQGTVIRRQKVVDRKTYIETPAARQATGDADTPEWQLLEGVEEVLITLQYTPEAIVAGRAQEAAKVTKVPPSESFSIQATFGGEATPIRGRIIYSATSVEGSGLKTH